MAIEHKDITEANLHQPKGASTATSGQRLQANGSGGTSFVDNDADLVNVDDTAGYYSGSNVETILTELWNGPCGSLYINGNTTAQTATGAGTNDLWNTGWVNGLAGGLTLDSVNGDITALVAGNYDIRLNASFVQSAATSADWAFKLAVNGVVKNELTVEVNATTTAKYTISLGGILTLAASDVVALYTERTSGATNLTIQQANLSVMKV